jgi:hypothetical protein
VLHPNQCSGNQPSLVTCMVSSKRRINEADKEHTTIGERLSLKPRIGDLFTIRRVVAQFIPLSNLAYQKAK